MQHYDDRKKSSAFYFERSDSPPTPAVAKVETPDLQLNNSNRLPHPPARVLSTSIYGRGTNTILQLKHLHKRFNRGALHRAAVGGGDSIDGISAAFAAPAPTVRFKTYR